MLRCSRSLLLLVFLLTGNPDLAGQTSAPSVPSRITAVRQLLDLPPEIAQTQIPVDVTGVITLSHPQVNLLFVQDDSAGIYVYINNNLKWPARGDKVRVRGSSARGLFSPIIVVEFFEPLGTAPQPSPEKLGIEEMASGRFDAQWVEVPGIVFHQFEDAGNLTLLLGLGSARLTVTILNAAKETYPDLVNARVAIQGVTCGHYQDRTKLTGWQLVSPSLQHVRVVTPGGGDPFSTAVRLSRDLMTYSRQGASEHRVKVSGVVTFFWPGRPFFYIRDESGGLRIHSRSTNILEPGDLVEAVGFSSLDGFQPRLEEALYRKVGTTNPPAARSATMPQLASGELDGDLVRIEGFVLKADELHPDHAALVIQADNQVFRARFRPGSGLTPSPAGSLVRVTGVCRTAGDAGLTQQTISIWMRGQGDLEFLRPPPGRYMQQAGWILGGGSILTLACGMWILLMRRRVSQKTDAIRKREAAVEDRYRDLFENANDMIYTHDLSGRLLSMNNAGQIILGYGPEELVGMDIAKLVEPEDLPLAREQTRLKLAGSPRTSYELRVRRKDGARLVLEMNTRLQFQEGRAVCVEGIARDITPRKQAEEALRLNEQQLRLSMAERERLGRDLHDGIIQSIYAVGLNLDDCARALGQSAPPVESRLRKITGDLNHVIREVRNFITGLEHNNLSGQEFKAALKSLVLTLGESHSARIDLNIDSRAADALAPATATQLLLVAREALSNSVRHAQARQITFSLQPGLDGVRFQVQDDGVGFHASSSEGKGQGLRNMATRAKEIGAVFTLNSQPGAGTRIVLDIPTETSHQSMP